MGKIAYIMNTLDRGLTTASVTEENVRNAGTHIDSFYFNDQGSREDLSPFFNDMARSHNVYLQVQEENIGNPQGFNRMCELASRQHDIMCIMANDIRMKPKWLSKAVELLENKDVGLVGFCWRAYESAPFFLGQHRVVEDSKIFGCWVFRTDFWKDVGYFSEFSKYGLWDSDYNNRAQLAGYRNVYLKGFESEHLINDCGKPTEYRRMKDEELSKATEKFRAIQEKYSEDCYHINKNQKLRCKPRVKGI